MTVAFRELDKIDEAIYFKLPYEKSDFPMRYRLFYGKSDYQTEDVVLDFLANYRLYDRSLRDFCRERGLITDQLWSKLLGEEYEYMEDIEDIRREVSIRSGLSKERQEIRENIRKTLSPYESPSWVDGRKPKKTIAQRFKKWLKKQFF